MKLDDNGSTKRFRLNRFTFRIVLSCSLLKSDSKHPKIEQYLALLSVLLTLLSVN